MKSLLYTIAAALCLATAAKAQVVVDPAIASSAQAAVQKLGLEMMKGNFKYGQERMYPRWKRRLAKRVGGMAELEAQLAASAQQRIKMNIAVIGFQASIPKTFFDVWKAKKLDPVTKKPVLDAQGKEIILEHWLAIVPTTVMVRFPNPQAPGTMSAVEEQSYTIAITEKGKNDWHFLTGLKPSIQDLRSLFPSLPATEKELGLPKPLARQIK